jgi:hypothetical protein
MAGEYTRINENHISIQNYDSDRGKFNEPTKRLNRENLGFRITGDETVISKRSMPKLEQVRRILPN